MEDILHNIYLGFSNRKTSPTNKQRVLQAEMTWKWPLHVVSTWNARGAFGGLYGYVFVLIFCQNSGTLPDKIP